MLSSCRPLRKKLCDYLEPFVVELFIFMGSNSSPTAASARGLPQRTPVLDFGARVVLYSTREGALFACPVPDRRIPPPDIRLLPTRPCWLINNLL